MQPVLARLQPTGLLVGLVIVLALVILVVGALSASAMHDPEPLVGPFRWLPDEPMA
jgi:hypothetical protein